MAHYVENVAAARLVISDADASELIVGGTGLYVTAIVDGLDMPGEYPEIRAALEANEDTEAMFAQLLALDPEAVGSGGVEMLLELLDAPTTPIENRYVPTKLVVRQSSSPAA